MAIGMGVYPAFLQQLLRLSICHLHLGGVLFRALDPEGGAKERDNYLSVLKAGGSDYPVDILKRAGLDMTTPAPYQAVVAVFKDTLDQAEALMA